jgi:ribosomal protein S12 methylthiotransferase accessory factor
MQNIPAPKITITSEIQEYLNKFYPKHYEWHFIDITYDLNIPTVFGICIGEAEFGKFIAIGASSRGTYSEALKKTISEIGQAVPYFRYMLDGKKKSKPIANFYEINSFDEHAIFYTTRPDLIHVFDIWRKKEPQKIIDFNENLSRSDREQILYMAKILKDKGYNFLVNDLTTPDVNQAKFYVLRVVVPQLLLLSGAYGLYFSGGKRLYEVPEKFGYKTFDFDNLNSFPHPFP